MDEVMEQGVTHFSPGNKTGEHDCLFSEGFLALILKQRHSSVYEKQDY